MSVESTLHGQLLEQARYLARRDKTRPRHGNLRRAVSGAYYAIFHLLVDEAARAFFAGPGPRLERLRSSLSRCLQHGEMNEVCLLFAGAARAWPSWLGPLAGPADAVPVELREVAGRFAVLMEARHAADYDLSRRLTRDEALWLVQRAEQARHDWLAVRKTEAARLLLLALTLPALGRFQKRVP